MYFKSGIQNDKSDDEYVKNGLVKSSKITDNAWYSPVVVEGFATPTPSSSSNLWMLLFLLVPVVIGYLWYQVYYAGQKDDGFTKK